MNILFDIQMFEIWLSVMLRKLDDFFVWFFPVDTVLKKIDQALS